VGGRERESIRGGWRDGKKTTKQFWGKLRAGSR
jgi:hypothetical protein